MSGKLKEGIFGVLVGILIYILIFNIWFLGDPNLEKPLYNLVYLPFYNFRTPFVSIGDFYFYFFYLLILCIVVSWLFFYKIKK